MQIRAKCIRKDVIFEGDLPCPSHQKGRFGGWRRQKDGEGSPHKKTAACKAPENDLAGSAKLMNFFDAGIAIGRSAKSSELRYVKQVKVRTGLNKYDGEKVLLFKLKQEQGYTQFIYEDTVSEADHLRQKNALTEAEDLQELIDLQAQNKTVREIAAETGFAPTTVHRKIKKALELGYKPSCSVPFHSGAEQAEQFNN